MTALATARTKMRRFSFSWSLASEAIRLAIFSCQASWLLVGLLTLCTVPPFFELRNRSRPTRVYLIHMALFVGLMVLGWAGVEAAGEHGSAPTWAAFLLMLAILIRCGTVPAHCWVTDWFEHTSFGIALLFVTPLTGVYAAVRLLLPIAPVWILYCVVVMSLFTAVYSAGMAIIQRDSRRFFAQLFLSHGSLVLAGLGLHTELSMTGSLCLWFSVILSLGGFGLTLRAMESRFGRLSPRRLSRALSAHPRAGGLLPAHGSRRASAFPGLSDSSRRSCWSIVPSRSALWWGSPWSRPRRSTGSRSCGPIC